MPKTEVVGHSSLSERYWTVNGYGTTLKSDGMNGCAGFALFPAHYGTRMSRGYATFLRVPTTRERHKKLRDFSSLQSVTSRFSPLLQKEQPDREDLAVFAIAFGLVWIFFFFCKVQVT